MSFELVSGKLLEFNWFADCETNELVMENLIFDCGKREN